jgi:hypothetical protein
MQHCSYSSGLPIAYLIRARAGGFTPGGKMKNEAHFVR